MIDLAIINATALLRESVQYFVGQVSVSYLRINSLGVDKISQWILVKASDYCKKKMAFCEKSCEA